MMNRRQETTIVKSELKKMGITKCKVSHGKGTAWGWLNIEIEKHFPMHQVIIEGGGVREMTQEEKGQLYYAPSCVGNCRACDEIRKLYNEIENRIATITGRKEQEWYKINIMIKEI